MSVSNSMPIAAGTETAVSTRASRLTVRGYRHTTTAPRSTQSRSTAAEAAPDLGARSRRWRRLPYSTRIAGRSTRQDSRHSSTPVPATRPNSEKPRKSISRMEKNAADVVTAATVTAAPVRWYAVSTAASGSSVWAPWSSYSETGWMPYATPTPIRVEMNADVIKLR